MQKMKRFMMILTDLRSFEERVVINRLRGLERLGKRAGDAVAAAPKLVSVPGAVATGSRGYARKVTCVFH